MSVREVCHRFAHALVPVLAPGRWQRRALRTRGALNSAGVLPFRGLVSPEFLAALPELYAKACSDKQREEHAAEVRRIREGERFVFGARHTFGEAIDYDLDVITGARWPFVPFHRVTRKGPDADIKSVWELGKLVELARLAWIGVARGSKHDVQLAGEEACRFLSINGIGLGVHWVSPLEVSIRTVSMLWVLTCLGTECGDPTHAAREILIGVAQHLDYLYGERSVYRDPNNHVIGEAVGLLLGGLALPGLDAAQEYVDEGVRILSREVPRQLDKSGWTHEASTDYHRQVVEWLAQATLGVRRLAGSQLHELESHLAAAVDAACALADRHGKLPTFGDSDGARVFALAPTPDVSANVFRAYRCLVRGADGVTDSVHDPLLALALAGMSGARAVASAPRWPKCAESRAPDGADRPVGGIYRLSDPESDPVGLDIYVKVSGAGLLPHRGHAHADLLSLQLFQGGLARITDPGTHRYGTSVSQRYALRSARHHATLYMPPDQADPLDLFKWATHPSTLPSQRIRADGVDIVSGGHDGYTRSRPGAVHRREVVRIDGGIIILVDRLGGSGSTRIVFPYPLGPEASSIDRSPLGTSGCTVHYADGGRLTIFSPHPHLEGVTRFDGPHGRHSAAYGRLVSVPRFELTAHVELPVEIVTLLHFSCSPERAPLAMTLRYDPVSVDLEIGGSSGQPAVSLTYRQIGRGGREIVVTERGRVRIRATPTLSAQWDEGV